MSEFRARGGKLIHYHGWSDPDISPINRVNYYESVVKAQGDDVHGPGRTEEFCRLFMVPGMWHCAGGPGATGFDMTGPLDEWVEKGVAPERVIAQKVTNGKVERTRPLCPHPLEPRWKGTRSTVEAGNFGCAVGKAQGAVGGRRDGRRRYTFLRLATPT